MRRDDQVDFFVIEDHQLAIHDRLENWARYVDAKGIVWQEGPIWKLGKSNRRQWDVPELRPPVNELDGGAMEIAVRKLPDKQRDALRWNYVYPRGSTARSPQARSDEGGAFGPCAVWSADVNQPACLTKAT